MTYFLTIDPGMSTGIFLGHYDDDTPLSRVAVWQVEGGVRGLLDWRNEHYIGLGAKWDFGADHVYHVDTVVAEKFTPLQNQGFNLTMDSVEPLRCEGAMIAHGMMPSTFPDERWQRPAVMYFCGGLDLADKKKRARAWLKEHGLLPTGKTVGRKDANDAVSATLHAFAYMRKIKHLPTLQHFWPES